LTNINIVAVYNTGGGKDEGTTKFPNWWKRLGEIRQKPYEDANDELKASWYALCEHIYPRVSKNWSNREIRANCDVSTRVTASDESFAIMCIQRNMAEWIKQQKIDEKKTRSPRKSKPSPKYKCKKTNWTTSDIRDFYRLQKELEELRGENETGKEWDDAYKKQVSKSTSAGSHVESMKRKAEKSDDDIVRRVKSNEDKIDYDSIPRFEI
jgi:hypothetical protein